MVLGPAASADNCADAGVASDKLLTAKTTSALGGDEFCVSWSVAEGTGEAEGA